MGIHSLPADAESIKNTKGSKLTMAILKWISASGEIADGISPDAHERGRMIGTCIHCKAKLYLAGGWCCYFDEGRWGKLCSKCADKAVYGRQRTINPACKGDA